MKKIILILILITSNYLICMEQQSSMQVDSASNQAPAKNGFDALTMRGVKRKKNAGEKTFKCDFDGCKYGTAYKANLKTHIRTHTGEKPYKCNTCGKAFTQSDHLTQHIRTHTGEKPFKCNTCGKDFNQSANLKTHIRTHTGKKPFKCNICSKDFAAKDNLTRHKKTHTGEKPYKCDECDKTFSEKGNLTRHQRTHSGEKPYKCDTCDYSCADPSALISHKRTHTGEKSFRCNTCDKTFARSEHLKTHIRIHTGEKPFKCSFDECAYETAYKSDLTKHKSTHEKKKALVVANAIGNTREESSQEQVQERAPKRQKIEETSSSALNMPSQQAYAEVGSEFNIDNYQELLQVRKMDIGHLSKEPEEYSSVSVQDDRFPLDYQSNVLTPAQAAALNLYKMDELEEN